MNNQNHSDQVQSHSSVNSSRNKKNQSDFFYNFISSLPFIMIICVIICLIFSVINTQKNGNSIKDIVENYVVPAENCYLYNQLDEYSQLIYDELLEQSPSGTNEFEIENVTYDDYQNHYKNLIDVAVTAFVFDHPEFFWNGSGSSSTYNAVNETIIFKIYQYDFWKNSTKKDEMVNELFTKVDEIVSSANQFDSTYEKIKFVHDYIVDCTVYDMEALDDIENNRWCESNPYHQTAYGALVKGSCVCAGYAKAFQLITQQLGYQCMYISGQTPPAEGESTPGLHAWNMIKLDENYYYFDLTWDDLDAITCSDGDVCYADKISYEYFAVTTKEFSEDHSNSYFTYPMCVSSEYNYYCHENYFFDRYSEKELRTAIETQFKNGLYEIALKFSDIETMKKAEEYLIDNFCKIQNECGYYEDSLRYTDETKFLIYWLPNNEW